MFPKILASSGYSEIRVLDKVHVMLCYRYLIKLMSYYLLPFCKLEKKTSSFVICCYKFDSCTGNYPEELKC